MMPGSPPFYSDIDAVYRRYPPQFWLMFFGMLLSTIGTSMIWPFLMIYVSEKLNLPTMTQATVLMTITSVATLVTGILSGMLVDRVGRKWVMVLGLFSHGMIYLMLSQASTYDEFVFLMALTGMATPLYRIGGDAMMADLVPPEKRTDAYALLRMSNNLGIAIGPAIGGVLAATSYSLAFLGAAIGLSTYSLLLIFFARETMPRLQPGEKAALLEMETAQGKRPLADLGRILKDHQFRSFLVVFTLVQFCATLIWVLLSVYTKQNYGIPESQYGLIATTNAAMVVTLQLAVTRITKRYQLLPVLTVGALFYAVATGGIALAFSFWGFWLCMVVMTIGELVIMPTSSTYTANLAPPDMRGRYMSLYGLTWSVAAMIGPILGGLLNDAINPRAIWIGGGIVGAISVMGFLMMQYRNSKG